MRLEGRHRGHPAGFSSFSSRRDASGDTWLLETWLAFIGTFRVALFSLV